MIASISSFVDELSRMPAAAGSTNMFAGAPEDSEMNALRRRNLELYLNAIAEHAPRVLLVGEAPGYRGMRITGVPFTNRAILGSGVGCFGLFGPENGYAIPGDLPGVPAEPTATVMWDVLTALNFLPLLWSAYPLHPHRPGNPLSNRMPSVRDVVTGRPFWHALRDIFDIQQVVAVGNVAYRSVSASSVGASVIRVRHPSHGGKVEFAHGLRALLEQPEFR